VLVLGQRLRGGSAQARQASEPKGSPLVLGDYQAL